MQVQAPFDPLKLIFALFYLIFKCLLDTVVANEPTHRNYLSHFFNSLFSCLDLI